MIFFALTYLNGLLNLQQLFLTFLIAKSKRSHDENEVSYGGKLKPIFIPRRLFERLLCEFDVENQNIVDKYFFKISNSKYVLTVKQKKMNRDDRRYNEYTKESLKNKCSERSMEVKFRNISGNFTGNFIGNFHF